MRRFLTYHKSDGFFWFRIFGYGLIFKNLKKHRLLFSERYKIRKSITIGNWHIKTVPYKTTLGGKK